MERPFWEDTYRDRTSRTFGLVSQEIIELAETLLGEGRVLDMGCGEGRNALFLAGAGFTVDAFDISEQGIDKLLATAERMEINVNAWVEDMRDFEFSRPYDLIISHGVFHLLPRDDWQRLIHRVKEYTVPGGVNVVAVFVDTLPTPADLIPHVKGLFREGELAELYAGWNVVSFESYIKEDEHPNGVKHRHPINKLVAQNRQVGMPI